MRHLAAILFIDIVGYTSMMGKNESRALGAIRKLNEISRPLVTSYGGKWHKDLGDGTLFSFGSSLEAVKCAIAIQQKINISEEFKVRIGIHLGDVTFEGEDVLGDGVNIASRIQGEAPIGGIAISDSVHKSIRNKEGIKTLKIGKKKLKNVEDPVELFQIKVSGVTTSFRKNRKINPWFLIIIGLIGGIIVNELVGKVIFSPELETNINRYSIILPNDHPLELIGTAPHGAGQRAFDISRDGKKMVFVVKTDAGPMLAYRNINSFEIELLEGTEGAFYPFFSPDGLWIGYFTKEHLKKVSTNTHIIEELTSSSVPKGAVWLMNDDIILSDYDGGKLIKITTVDNKPIREEIPLPEGYSHIYWPASTSDYDKILLSTGNSILVYDYRKNLCVTLVREGSTPIYLPSGYLVYTHEGRLKAAEFNPENMEISGSFSVLDDVRTEAIRKGSQFSIAENGKLIYVPGNPVDQGILVLVDREGNEIDTLSLPPDNFGAFSLSPNSKHLIYNSGNKGGLWLYDIERGITNQLSEENGINIWSTNGNSFTYQTRISDQSAIVDRSIADLEIDTILMGNNIIGPYDWSPDKSILIYVTVNESTLRDMMYLDISNDNPMPQVLTNLPVHEMFADFSPNGNYFVYESTESSGIGEIFVQPFPPTGKVTKISNEGGSEPFWTTNGNEIIYMSQFFTRMMSVPIDWKNGFNPGTPTLLWEKSYLDVPGRSYSITPDSELFLMKKSIETVHTRNELLVVENWLEELKSILK